MIATPDILPNNLRIVKEWKEKTTEETANALSVNRSYISILENSKANMSGSIAVSIMDYFQCTFAQLFEMHQTMSLEYSKEIYSDRIAKILITKEELIAYKNGDIINIVKKVEEDFKKYNLTGQIDRIEELSVEDISNEKIMLTLKVIILDTIVEMKEFDLSLSKDTNIELYKNLLERGFMEDELFSIKYIENFLGISSEQTQEAIGLSSEGYEEVLSGEKKIPVKIMWRLVKFFKVPLESIMNIKQYKKIITPIDL